MREQRRSLSLQETQISLFIYETLFLILILQSYFLQSNESADTDSLGEGDLHI